jgi:hypothetical protein
VTEIKSLNFLYWYKHFKSDRDKLVHFPKKFISIQEGERVYLCHFWNVCIKTGKWVSLTPSLLKCLYHDRKVSEFNSITFEMSVSRQESERVYLCHLWNVCIKTGKWVSLTRSLLKCLFQDRKVSEFISVTFEMFVSIQESERVYLRHFWNVCIKETNISKVTELNSLTFLSWYKHFKSDGDKLAPFPVLIQTFQKGQR